MQMRPASKGTASSCGYHNANPSSKHQGPLPLEVYPPASISLIHTYSVYMSTERPT
ncbi:hypothetical protein BGX38DRAFT_1225387 [Terfezia claveryi]|nr:hypothetical protein BGX38DRAFT_1225387 [Terfezia claveryi]